MAVYDEVVADVAEVLAELGRSVTYNRYTVVNDLVAGTSVPTLSLTQPLSSAILPWSGSGMNFEGMDVSWMDNVQDATEKRLALVTASGATFVPSPKDVAVFGGNTWNIAGCTPINVNGTDIVFIVGLVLP